MADTQKEGPTEGKVSPRFHFTYAAPEGDLKQGDLLAKTDAILGMLEEVHRYYLDESYTHFLVLTQTCDLVQRDGQPPKSRYITIAGVRPLDLAVRREIESFQTEEIHRVGEVAAKEERHKLIRFLERVMNQNQDDYFFLHQEPSVGLSEDSCAFLRLTIPLRWQDHIDKCHQARILSLSEVFRAKLGWMVGSVYSRVGTTDFVGKHKSKGQWRREMGSLLDGMCHWVEYKRLKKAAETLNPDTLRRGKEAVWDHIQSVSLPSPKAEVVSAFMQISKEFGVFSDTNREDELEAQLVQDPRLSAALKRFLKANTAD